MVMWALWAALSWWSAPRQTDVAQARADLAAGRVASYQWGDAWRSEHGRWATSPRLESSGAQGPLFVWRTPYGRTHYAVTDDASGVGEVADPAQYSGPEAASLAEALASAGLDEGPVGTDWPKSIISAAVVVLGVSFLGVLVTGPAPVTGTRWLWIWLVSGPAFGLGLLYWLTRERPWSSTAAPVAARPDGREPRRRWYVGFAIGLLASFVGALLVYALDRLLGDQIVPRYDT